MYKKKEVLLTGFALFAMLFGAGNLIFPPVVGYTVGTNWIYALIGFFITGIGFPLLAIISATLAGDKLDNFAERVSPKFSKIFNIVLILAIGPLLALPRTGATAFEMAIAPHLSGNTSVIKYSFLIVYFIISLIFSLKSNKVIDRVGKILTPILIVILSIIIYKGVSSPIGDPVVSQVTDSFKYGFFNGYQTMDTLASVIFSGIILKSIRNGRNLSKKQELSFLTNSSLIALFGLTIVYGGLLYIGATSSGALTNYGTTRLLADIVNSLLGKSGIVFLGICIAGACLTTAVGLTATVADYFSDLLKISYEKIAVATTVISFLFASLGVDMIVKISAPILVLLYPIAIVLIALNFFGKRIKNDGIYLGAVIGAGFVGVIEMLQALNINISLLNHIYKILPLQSFGLGWVVPAIIFGTIVGLIKKEDKKLVSI
ncbi:MAG: branched-chain amino acid transport system II carrier protein [Cetobacterium sp.]